MRLLPSASRGAEAGSGTIVEYDLGNTGVEPRRSRPAQGTVRLRLRTGVTDKISDAAGYGAEVVVCLPQWTEHLTHCQRLDRLVQDCSRAPGMRPVQQPEQPLCCGPTG